MSHDIILHPHSAPQPVSGVQIYLYRSSARQEESLSLSLFCGLHPFLHLFICYCSLFRLLPSLCSVQLVPLPAAFRGLLACPAGFGAHKPRGQMKPRPAPLGLCVARMGSVMPRPSGPRPMPGLQPILCNIRFPVFDSGRGPTFSPTTPREKISEHV